MNPVIYFVFFPSHISIIQQDCLKLLSNFNQDFSAEVLKAKILFKDLHTIVFFRNCKPGTFTLGENLRIGYRKTLHKMA